MADPAYDVRRAAEAEAKALAECGRAAVEAATAFLQGRATFQCGVSLPSMLGLGAATAVGSETFSAPPDSPGAPTSVSGAYDKERYAAAFEHLAAELRRDAVEIQSLDLSSSLSANEMADCHTLVLKFRYMPEV